VPDGAGVEVGRIGAEDGDVETARRGAEREHRAAARVARERRQLGHLDPPRLVEARRGGLVSDELVLAALLGEQEDPPRRQRDSERRALFVVGSREDQRSGWRPTRAHRRRSGREA
jgi:hypothetical protein